MGPSLMTTSDGTKDAITKGMQMTLLAGFLGWMMDGYEQALFPTLAGPALKSMVPPDIAALGATAINAWVGVGWAISPPLSCSALRSVVRPSVGWEIVSVG